MEPTARPELASPVVLEYRLTEGDVRRYANSGRALTCLRIGREQAAGLVVLVALGLALFGLCVRSRGARPAARAAVSTLSVLGALAWLRATGSSRRACRLARDLGVPLDLRLTASPAGLTKEHAAGGFNPGRTFAWREVVEVGRVAHLTVLRFRPAGSVLLIPDRAFPDPRARERFVEKVRGWHRGGPAVTASARQGFPGR